MKISPGGRHLYKSTAYTRVTKVVRVRRKGKSSYGDQIWELTLSDGTAIRTSAQAVHPFTTNEDFPRGILVRLDISRARGTVIYAELADAGRVGKR